MNLVRVLLGAVLLLILGCSAKVPSSLQSHDGLAKHESLKSEILTLKNEIMQAQNELVSMHQGNPSDKPHRDSSTTVSSPSPRPEYHAQMHTLPSSTIGNFYSSVVSPGDMIEIHYYRNSLLQTPAYEVGSGDVLKVNVFEHPNLSQDRVLVLPDGYISAPLVNRLLVAGNDVDTISKELTEIYKSKKIHNPQVAVSVMESDQRLTTLLRSLNQNASSGLRIRVDMTGDMNLPFIGPIKTGRPLSVIQKDIQNAYQKVFAGQLEVSVNITAAAVKKVYVIGEVSRPSGVDYSMHLNSVMAIAAAGGFLSTADRSAVRLVRYKQDGTNEQWEINLEDPMGKRQQNNSFIRVLPNDVLYVPKSGVAVANQFVDQYIRKMLPIDFSAGIFIPAFGQ